MAVNFVRYCRDISPAWARRRFGQVLMGVLAAKGPSELCEALWRVVRLRWLLDSESTEDQINEEMHFRGLESRRYRGGVSEQPGALATRADRIERARAAITTWRGEGSGALMSALKDDVSRILGIASASVDIIAERSTTASYTVKTTENIQPNGGYIIACYLPAGYETGYRTSRVGDVIPFQLGGGVRETLTRSLLRAVERFSPAQSRCRAVYLITERCFPLAGLWDNYFEVSRNALGVDESGEDIWDSGNTVPTGIEAGTRSILEIFGTTLTSQSIQDGDGWIRVFAGGVGSNQNQMRLRNADTVYPIAAPFSVFLHFDDLFADGSVSTVVHTGTPSDGLHFKKNASDEWDLALLENGNAWSYSFEGRGLDGAQHTLLLTVDLGNVVTLYVDGEQVPLTGSTGSGTLVNPLPIAPPIYDGNTAIDFSNGGVEGYQFNVGMKKLNLLPEDYFMGRMRRVAWSFKSTSPEQAREMHRLAIVTGGLADYPSSINADFITRDWRSYLFGLVDGGEHVFASDFSPRVPAFETGSPFIIGSDSVSDTDILEDWSDWDALAIFFLRDPTSDLEFSIGGQVYDLADFDYSDSSYGAVGLFGPNDTGLTEITVAVTDNGTFGHAVIVVPLRGVELVDGGLADGDGVNLNDLPLGFVLGAGMADGTTELTAEGVQLYNESQSSDPVRIAGIGYTSGLEKVRTVRVSNELSSDITGALALKRYSVPDNRIEIDFNTNRFVRYEGLREYPFNLPGLDTATAGYTTKPGAAQKDPERQYLWALQDGQVYSDSLYGDSLAAGLNFAESLSLEWFGYIANDDSDRDNLISLGVALAPGTVLSFLLGIQAVNGTLAVNYVGGGNYQGLITVDLLSTDPGFHHVIATRRKGSLQVYLDGELANLATLPDPLPGADAPGSAANERVVVGSSFAVGSRASAIRTVYARVWGSPLPAAAAKYQYLKTRHLLDRGFGYVVPVNPGISEAVSGASFNTGFNAGFEI